MAVLRLPVQGLMRPCMTCILPPCGAGERSAATHTGRPRLPLPAFSWLSLTHSFRFCTYPPAAVHTASGSCSRPTAATTAAASTTTTTNPTTSSYRNAHRGRPQRPGLPARYRCRGPYHAVRAPHCPRVHPVHSPTLQRSRSVGLGAAHARRVSSSHVTTTTNTSRRGARKGSRRRAPGRLWRRVCSTPTATCRTCPSWVRTSTRGLGTRRRERAWSGSSSTRTTTTATAGVTHGAARQRGSQPERRARSAQQTQHLGMLTTRVAAAATAAAMVAVAAAAQAALGIRSWATAHALSQMHVATSGVTGSCGRAWAWRGRGRRQG